ncbi:MAG: YihY/virulence factor BrkB family protein [Promicromonosporaceae bacterium]|nr:YihY/virulence factor BrkB family protein [Promicromonosporaceae bacterium]
MSVTLKGGSFGYSVWGASSSPNELVAFGSVGERIRRIVEWAKNSRAGRTVAWFMACNGGQLSAGIAYQTLFSLFAILTVAWSAFSASLGRYPGLQAAVLDQINGWVPGLIGAEESALISPDQLVIPSALNWASLVAIVMGPVWIYRVMTAVRTAICRICAVSRFTDTRIWDQVSKFLGFLIMAAGVLVTAVASIAAQALGGYIIEAFGPQTGNLVSIATQVIVAAFGAFVNALMIIGAIRLVARVWFVSDHKRRQIWWGGLGGGFILSLFRWLGTSIVMRVAANNTLLAPFAAIVTILMLANFTVYILLMVCAWVYDPPRLDRVKNPHETRERATHKLFHRRAEEKVLMPGMIWHVSVRR